MGHCHSMVSMLIMQPMRRTSPLSLLCLLASVVLLASACGGGDDGASVREIGGDDDSGSGEASASGSSSAPSEDGGTSGSSEEDGGYEYASNVDAHRLVVADLCGIGELLDAGDFETVAGVYRDGVNSVNSDGSVRSIGGFAASDDRSHGLDTYYGTPTPLDDFVTAAFDGAGIFDGQSDAVRAQGVEKGIQNQVMVAWVVHELNSALAKADEGNFDIAEGAVHNWDEGWAFFHGSEPGCAPYATADNRAADFGTVGDDGETALANEQILAAMIEGRDALIAEDAASAGAAATEVVRNLVITYAQAAIRYASLIEGDLAEGDAEGAKEHQVEGLAFWRVIESTTVANGADADTINAILDLGNEPGANGFGDEVRGALQPALDALGISDDDIGELR